MNRVEEVLVVSPAMRDLAIHPRDWVVILLGAVAGAIIAGVPAGWGPAIAGGVSGALGGVIIAITHPLPLFKLRHYRSSRSR
jgi:hypothetical protein